MLRYVGFRLALALPTLFVVTIVVFLMVEATPGDVAQRLAGANASAEDIENIRRQLGLDRPVLVRYGEFIGRVARADLGRSQIRGVPVATLIAESLPATLELAAIGLVIAVLVGVPLGTVGALTHGSIWDDLTTALAVAGMSIPIFWLGFLLIWIFSIELGWVPTSGRGSASQAVLPALTLAGTSLAMVARLTRSGVLEILRLDYVRTARAKGLPHLGVIVRHVLPNAIGPVITVVGMQLGYLLGGSVLTEAVFAWPGMGQLLVTAILDHDLSVVQGAVLVFAAGFVLLNLVVDMLQAYADPRIQLR